MIIIIYNYEIIEINEINQMTKWGTAHLRASSLKSGPPLGLVPSIRSSSSNSFATCMPSNDCARAYVLGGLGKRRGKKLLVSRYRFVAQNNSLPTAAEHAPTPSMHELTGYKA